MMISIIGDCDNRPVLYTLLKMCQTLGDVLLVTGNRRLLRMTDTKESGGHLQNCMIGYAQYGIDDFFESFEYIQSDFNYIIVDNLIAAEADCVIYARGLKESEDEQMQLEYIDDYITIDMFKKELSDNKTLFKCEEFEAYGDMCTINKKLATVVAKAVSKAFNISDQKLTEIATAEPTNTYVSVLPSTQPKKGLRGKVGGLFGL